MTAPLSRGKTPSTGPPVDHVWRLVIAEEGIRLVDWSGRIR